MSLAVGAHLGHYQIIARLGAGGRGEVYLAEDTNLDRKVALKLLSAEFTKDADRVRRFEPEWLTEIMTTRSTKQKLFCYVDETGQDDRCGILHCGHRGERA